MKNIIIGSGIAGHSAAAALRKADPESQILMITADQEATYFRPRLIDYLGNRVPFDKILVKPESFYEENRIELRLGTRVTEIDAENRCLHLEGGEKESWDQLLLATGARSFIPPIEGAEKPGVFAFRDRPDADAIKVWSEGRDRAVVVGGGLLGLETAHSLSDLGLKVEVVEFFDRLLPRQLDEEGAAVLQGLLEKKGLSFTLGAQTEAFQGDTDLESVRLKSGREIPAEVAVVSTGVRSRLELAEQAGLEIDKAVVVGDDMRTSRPGIFAAGDAVIHQGRFYGLWMPAKEQGEAAGRAMAGEAVQYEGSTLEARLKITGISLFSAGDFQEKEGDTVKISRGDGVYRKVLFREGVLTGAIVLGDNKGAALVSQVFSGRKDVKELETLF